MSTASPLWERSAREVVDMLRRGDVTPHELLDLLGIIFKGTHPFL